MKAEHGVRGKRENLVRAEKPMSRVKMEIVAGDPKSQEKSLRLAVISMVDFDRLSSTETSAETNNPTNGMVSGP